jgi:hypothetical protein
MSILDDIKNNSIDELHLSNLPEDYFGTAAEFEAAMKDNTSIKTVILDGDFLVCLKAEDRAIVVSCVGKLPNVEKVVLKDSRLMVGVCMTNLVKNASKLHDLSMVNCTLQGVPEDFDKFRDALVETSGMKTLDITDCFAPNSDVNLDKVMDSLRESLSITITGTAGK